MRKRLAVFHLWREISGTVLVVGDAQSFAGCLLNVKLIGSIHAKQTEKGKNDP